MNKTIFVGASFCFFAYPFFAGAQTPVLTPTEGVISTPTALSTPVQGDVSAPTMLSPLANAEQSPLDDKIKAAQQEITDITNQRSDTGLTYNHILRTNVETLMREKAEELKKGGDNAKAEEILKTIDEWEVIRNREWDQDDVLLEKKSALQQLRIDRAIELNKYASNKYSEIGNEKKVKELKESENLLEQMKTQESQYLQLSKDLLRARQNYDLKKADELRQKQKALRDQLDDLTKQSKQKIKTLETQQDINEQNL
jgi:hypothetical protein